MKRLLFFIVALFVAVFSQADTYKIIKLNKTPVVIGGKAKGVNSTFTNKETIVWKYNNQGMWVRDLTNGGYRYFSKEAFESVGASTAYNYLKTNHPSSRGGYDLLPYTKAAYNSERRLALLIGNSNYAYEPSLRNPIADVTEVSDKLRELGFDVLRVFDADQKTIDEALVKFQETATAKGYATTLFYYAGHGQQYKGETYLLPVDANVVTPYDIKNRCTPGPRVVSFINEISANTNIVIIDACRSEKSLLRSSSVEELHMKAPDNGIVLFSTKSGEPALDGDGIHSPFADALLQNITKTNISLQDMVIQVTNDVKRMTSNNDSKQIPNNMASLDHSFYFSYIGTLQDSTPIYEQNGKQQTEEKNGELQRLKEEIARLKAAEDARRKAEEKKQHTETGAFRVTEQTPAFPGGEVALTKWLADHIKYPPKALENNIQGRVVVKFNVTKTGSIGEVEIVRSVNSDLDNEAIRLIKTLPNFTPGRINGEAVNMCLTLPVQFMLDINQINGHEWVDLGLSVKWATCNVGASSPSDYGGYYAWAETETKSYYINDNYFDGIEPIDSANYGPNGLLGIVPTYRDDAARENWGGTWRMPTKVEFDELREKCNWTWTSQNGHDGYLVTGPNGKCIFLPAAGCIAGDTLSEVGLIGNYWSNRLNLKDAHSAHSLWFDSSECEDNDIMLRWVGLSIRPVTD